MWCKGRCRETLKHGTVTTCSACLRVCTCILIWLTHRHMLPVARPIQYTTLGSAIVVSIRRVTLLWNGLDIWERRGFSSFRYRCTIMTRQISCQVPLKQKNSRPATKCSSIMMSKPLVFKDVVSISKWRFTSGTWHLRFAYRLQQQR